MKYKVSLLIILFPLCTLAQQRATTDSVARSMLQDLFDSWTLGIDSNAEVVDIRIYNKFKSLFDPGATIDDDFNVFYVYDSRKRSGAYQIKKDANPKAFDVYVHDLALQLRSITIDSVEVLDSSIADRSNISFTIRRRVRIQKTRRYVLPGNYADELVSGRAIEFENKKDSLKMVSGLRTKADKDPEAIYEFTSVNTIRIIMAYEADSIRIKNIKSMANEVVCTNDADDDAVLNQEDMLPNKPGDFTANGKPDYDLDGLSDETDKCRFTYGDTKNHGCPLSYFLTKNRVDGFMGLQYNAAKMAMPGLGQLDYPDITSVDVRAVPLSKPGVLKSPSNALGVYGGGSFTRYFGQKRKRTGISIGFTYAGFTATYKLTDTARYIYKASDGISTYRRQIIIRSSKDSSSAIPGMNDPGLKEEIKYSVFNVPVLFDYRLYLNRNHKLVLNMQAGPSLMIFNNVSSYSAVIDFGGIYQFDATRKVVYNTNPFDNKSYYTVYFTTDSINARYRPVNPNAAHDIFNMLDSVKYLSAGNSPASIWDFASNKKYDGKQSVKRVAIAANLNLDFQYKVSEGFTVKFGPHVVYASYLPAKTKYRPVNSTTDEYQSIYKSNAKMSYSAYGMNLGFVYDF